MTTSPLPPPSRYGTCPYPHCKRTVGPYYESHQATLAIELHIEYAHTHITMAESMVPAEYRSVA